MVGEAVVVEAVQLQLAGAAVGEVGGQGVEHRVGLVGDVGGSAGGAAVRAGDEQGGAGQGAEQGEAEALGVPVRAGVGHLDEEKAGRGFGEVDGEQAPGAVGVEPARGEGAAAGRWRRSVPALTAMPSGANASAAAVVSPAASRSAAARARSRSAGVG